jgi:hypothetical protein
MTREPSRAERGRLAVPPCTKPEGHVWTQVAKGWDCYWCHVFSTPARMTKLETIVELYGYGVHRGYYSAKRPDVPIEDLQAVKLSGMLEYQRRKREPR